MPKILATILATEEAVDVGSAHGVLMLAGAGCFGAVLGWYLYYVNRYRKDEVKLADLVTVVGVIGGGAVLALFPKGMVLFGAYGIGLAMGFFSYFRILVYLVRHSKGFTSDWSSTGVARRFLTVRSRASPANGRCSYVARTPRRSNRKAARRTQ